MRHRGAVGVAPPAMGGQPRNHSCADFHAPYINAVLMRVSVYNPRSDPIRQPECMKPSHLSVKERYLLNLWNDYLHSGKLHQLDRFLAQALRQIKNAGKRDRLWYGDHLFAMSRFSWLALFIDSLPDEAPNPDRMQQQLQTWQPPVTVAAAEKALQRLPAPLLWQVTAERLYPRESGAGQANSWIDCLHQLATQGNDPTAKLLWAGISPHWWTQIQARANHDGWSTTQVEQFIESHTTRPPLYVRPVPGKRDAVIDDLEQNQLHCDRIHHGLRVSGSKGLYELESYKKGWFEIQDLASQAIGEHVAPQSGDLGWDACAGGGGKSLQLASLMQGKGAVYASDIREHKLDEVRRRAQRAQLHNIRTFVWQGAPLDRLPAAVQKRGGFDWVLVDAPCTSSGTWRRNPDARWRCDAQQIQDITGLQAKLLNSASQSVRPGGKLVYSTCSFFIDENETIVENFLGEHPEFSLQESCVHGSPNTDADTMFSALLIRKPYALPNDKPATAVPGPETA